MFVVLKSLIGKGREKKGREHWSASEKKSVLIEDIISALKELPDTVKKLKVVVSAVKVPPLSPAPACSTSSSVIFSLLHQHQLK
ncbi:hypothetical protein AMEX_G6027 [Astyanax mexicanus]|uniref:Uncharacterized protein n=1 Tax=Astyanax mexicanus TaxID=7994 RepID=A0A8T2M8X7_ASTMX|nr:hypothetical protein AMEX_G6027 [Astyanax mexicanus]